MLECTFLRKIIFSPNISKPTAFKWTHLTCIVLRSIQTLKLFFLSLCPSTQKSRHSLQILPRTHPLLTWRGWGILLDVTALCQFLLTGVNKLRDNWCVLQSRGSIYGKEASPSFVKYGIEGTPGWDEIVWHNQSTSKLFFSILYFRVETELHGRKKGDLPLDRGGGDSEGNLCTQRQINCLQQGQAS